VKAGAAGAAKAGQNAGAAGPAIPPYLGKKRPVRGKLPHGVPSWVKAGEVFFITLCAAPRGRNQLCQRTVAEGIFEAVEFRVARQVWHVSLWLLMPDHLHALISFPSDGDMSVVIANFKENTAKNLGIVWQRDFFDHRLRSDAERDEKVHYIWMNPVRKGLVVRAEDWVFFWTPDKAADLARGGEVVKMAGNAGAAGPAVPPYLGIGYDAELPKS
jgi:putative transposase